MFAFTILFMPKHFIILYFCANYEMKRFLGIFLVIIFFIACGENRPQGIFNEKKMTDVLFDIHIADNYINNMPADTLNEEKVNYYLTIYQKYNTDSAQVRQNLEYYSEHPQELQDIYAEISKRLRTTEEDLGKLEAEKRLIAFKSDSIKRQRRADSLNLFKRDSILYFNGKRNLFLHHIDSLKDSLNKVVSLDTVSHLVRDEQKLWEMTFYYFNKDTAVSTIRPRTLGGQKNEPSNPSSDKKRELIKAQ
jgi:hypothetical protein